MTVAEEIEGLISIKEAAEILNVHPHTIRLWAFMGVIKGYQIGHRGDWRFRRSELEDYLESGRMNGRPRE